MFYVSPQGLSRASQEAFRSSQNDPTRAPGAAKMTPNAAHAAPRGAQDSFKGAQEPHRSSQDALKSSLEGHIGCQEAPKSPPRLPRGSREAPKCAQEGPKACPGASHEALCRASSAKRRDYKTVMGTQLAQTRSQHHEGPVQLDMLI